MQTDATRLKQTFLRLITQGVEGFTLAADGTEFTPSEGYAVGIETCKDIDEAITLVNEDQYIGWYRDPNTGKGVINIVKIFESNLVACMTALCYKQRSFYNFSTDQTVDLSGLYSVPVGGEYS